MISASAGLALGAGMLAALNPCGFALLPAYLTLLVTGDKPTRAVAVGRAARMTLAMTAGFTSVFAIFGVVVAPFASSAQRFLPWFSLVIGLLILAAGIWLLAGRSFPSFRIGSREGAPVTRSLRSMFGFGVSYALASLTCTIAPFLAVVVAAFRAESLFAGSVLFLIYAAGMGLVVGTAALAVALAQQAIIRGAHRMGRFVPLLGGVLLAVVGAYVAYYGWWEIRVLSGGPTADPIIEAAASVQNWLANFTASVGAWGFLALLGGLLLAILMAGVASRWRSRRHAESVETSGGVST